MKELLVYEPVKIFADGRFTEISKSICVEKNIDVYVNETYFMSIMCLPEKLKDLVVGFLFNNDVIEKYLDIECHTNNSRRKFRKY